MKINVVGRPDQSDEPVYTLDNETMEGIYSDRMTFANLRHSDMALSFDLFVIADEKIYRPDE